MLTASSSLRVSSRLLTLGCFTALWLGSPMVSFAQNLVENGDLEGAVSPETGLPAGWRVFQQPENAYKVQVVDGGHGGKKCVQISGKGDYCVVHVKQVSKADGKRFLGAGWINVTSPEGRASLKFDFNKADGEYVNSNTLGDITAKEAGWQSVALMDRSPEFPKADLVALALAVNGNVTAQFDDIQLTEAKAAGENLVLNGDFEEHLGSTVGNAWVGCAEGGKVKATISHEKPQSGGSCMFLKSDAEWAVVTMSKVPFDKKKTYTFTGFVRLKSGTAQIKIDYFNGDEYIGSTTGDDAYGTDWQKQSVQSEAFSYPTATHISATAVGVGESEAFFDNFVLTAK